MTKNELRKLVVEAINEVASTNNKRMVLASLSELATEIRHQNMLAVEVSDPDLTLNESDRTIYHSKLENGTEKIEEMIRALANNIENL